MIKIDLVGASAMNESYSVIENQGYVAAFVDRTILKNVSGPRDDALKEIVFKVHYSGVRLPNCHPMRNLDKMTLAPGAPPSLYLKTIRR